MSEPIAREIIRRKAFETLHVPLSIEERADLGQEIADLIGQEAKLELERKASNDIFKSKIDLIEAQRNDAAARMRIGTKDQRTEVEVSFDYTGGTISVHRKDTGSLVRTRTMDLKERQLEFAATREPGGMVDFGGGKVLSLEDERTNAEKLADDGVVELEAPADGLRSDLTTAGPGVLPRQDDEEPAPATEEPGDDTEEDDTPFGDEPDADVGNTDLLSRLREGDAVWIADGDGIAVGKKMIVASVRQGVQKNNVMAECRTEDGKAIGAFPHHKLTMIAPVEKKAKSAKKLLEQAIAESPVTAGKPAKKPKPKFTQGTEVIRSSDGRVFLICGIGVVRDTDGRIAYMAQPKGEKNHRMTVLEDELTSTKPARKPRAPKASAAS